VSSPHRVAREVAVMVYFRGEPLMLQVLDMIVDEKVVVESKSTERLPPTTSAQLFGYLAATKLEVGLILHFGREARAHRVLFENRFKKFT
jgi:GxxExxY protein